MFRKLSLPLVAAALVIVLTGCVASGPKPAEAIIGQWQTSVGNFPMVSIQLNQSFFSFCPEEHLRWDSNETARSK